MKRTAIIIIIILIDISIYIILGTLLMEYEDFYDGSQGEFYSFNSLTRNQKFFLLAFWSWNGFNILTISFLAFRVIRKIKKTLANNRSYVKQLHRGQGER